ncbi:MAG: hypothetical protein AAGH43_03810 [Pseudomonadota bacterium]
MIRTVLPALALLIVGSVAQAENWRVSTLPAASPNMFAERCDRAPQGLPDGCVARGSGDVRAAWYTEPTDRYRHAILGDALEAGALTVRLANGAQTTFRLPQDQVFEDRTPRLADLDGDGRTEIITIRASTRLGGSVAVFGVRGETLVEIAATPYIGRSNRWLNIAGMADFLGRGDLQVAFVETPHIGGTLKLATFDGHRLQVVARAGGFSNHEIRSREQRLSAIADIDGDGRMDLALPDARRTQLRLVRFAAGRIENIASVPLPAAIVQPVASEGSNNSLRFLAGLADGSVISVARDR